MVTEQLMDLALNMGEKMLRSGAEIYRVEDTMRRVCRAYSAERAEVFSITSCIILTVQLPDEAAKTQIRRIDGYDTDLTRLEKLNEFSRYICEEIPPLDEAITMFSGIEPTSDRPCVRAVLYAFVSASFSVFFGGGVREALISAGIAVCLFYLEYFFSRMRLNRFFLVFLTSAICGFLAATSARFGLVHRVDRIIIGNIMPLVPGLAFTTSIRDMVNGDIISGLLRLVESLFLAVALAAGFAIALLPFGIGG